MNTFGAQNPLTSLVPSLRDVDPDDAFSSVPYEKGFALLYHLETLLGGPGNSGPRRPRACVRACVLADVWSCPLLVVSL